MKLVSIPLQRPAMEHDGYLWKNTAVGPEAALHATELRHLILKMLSCVVWTLVL